jgi:hypothetical protein
MPTYARGNQFNVYFTGRPVPMSNDTAREVALGCQALSMTPPLYGRRAHADDPAGALARRKEVRRASS